MILRTCSSAKAWRGLTARTRTSSMVAVATRVVLTLMARMALGGQVMVGQETPVQEACGLQEARRARSRARLARRRRRRKARRRESDVGEGTARSRGECRRAVAWLPPPWTAHARAVKAVAMATAKGKCFDYLSQSVGHLAPVSPSPLATGPLPLRARSRQSLTPSRSRSVARLLRACMCNGCCTGGSAHSGVEARRDGRQAGLTSRGPVAAVAMTSGKGAPAASASEAGAGGWLVRAGRMDLWQAPRRLT